jgi:hypothetical protein
MRWIALCLLVSLAGCRSIKEVEGDAFRTRVEGVGDRIAAARKAAERESVPEVRKERRAELDDIEKAWDEAQRVGEAALELDDRPALEYARGLMDDVERRLSVLPRNLSR